MNLHTLLFTENDCYKWNVENNKQMTPKGLFLHSTGVNQTYLKRYVGPDDGYVGKNRYNNHWNQPSSREVCVHGFIGRANNGEIASYQTLPWDFTGWHSGAGSKGNANFMGYIGVEICEDDLKDATYFNAVYKEAVELFGMLAFKFNIEVKSPYVICHSEGAKLGIASNHADVMHWFPKHGKSMDTFRADVKAEKERLIKEEEAKKLKFKVGDKVNFLGGNFYTNSVAGSFKTTTAGPAEVTKAIIANHPYHIIHTDDTTEVHGWVNADQVELWIEPTAEYTLVVDMVAFPSAEAAKNGSTTIGTTFKAGTYYIHPSYPDGKDGMICLCNNYKNPGLGFWIDPAKNVVPKPEPKPEPIPVTPPSAIDKNTFKVGDIIMFKGTSHYRSANGKNPTKTNLKGGLAKVTAKYNGKHPYHLIHVDNQSNVYGWVDCKDIDFGGAPLQTYLKKLEEEEAAKKAAEEAAKKAAEAKVIKAGDKVRVNKGAKSFSGGNLASYVYTTVYDVIEVSRGGERVVIGKGKAVTAAMNSKDLTKVVD